MSLLPQESSNNSTNINDWKEYLANECHHDLIRHDNLINYSRSLCREQLYCVMCGRSKGTHCEIPNQNKDVCKTCDSLIWKVEKLNVVVKFCKGCKNFTLLSAFGDKPLAAKCSKCRQRGRQHYHTKKTLDTAASSSSEQRNQLYLTPPPPSPCAGRTISPIHLSPFPYLSPQSVSCGEVSALSRNIDVQRKIPSLPSLTQFHPSVGLIHVDPPSPPADGLWDPTLHPLMNLAAVSEQILNPTSSPPPLSPTPGSFNPETTPPHTRSQNEKKRKR